MKIKRLVSNSFVQKWFFTLLLLISFLFICFIIYIRSSSDKILQAEHVAYSELQTERLTSQLDDSFSGCSQIPILLNTDRNVRLFQLTEQPELLFPKIYKQLDTELSVYRAAFSALDSIYLYSSASDSFFLYGSYAPCSYQSLQDNNCLTVEEIPDEITYIARKKNNLYPYLITMYYPIRQNDIKNMIVINIDISKITVLKENHGNSRQRIYIVSDEGQLLYRENQENMPENIETAPELIYFDNNRSFLSHYIDTAEPYVYVQQHSEKFPWYYVTITEAQNFYGKSVHIYKTLLNIIPWLIPLALLLIIWLVLLATHPIRTISDFLKDPLSQMPEDISDSETRSIIREFLNYIQVNQTLSEEFQKQMQQQNEATFRALQSQINPHFLLNTLNLIRNMEIDTLGYDHNAPKLTLALSRLLQYALDSASLVPLKTEFYYTNLFLHILNLRYENRLYFDIKKDDAVDEAKVPKLILQPLIENAVFHGCSPQSNVRNNILITAQIEDGLCKVTVQDNGIGMSPEQLETLRIAVTKLDNIPSDSIGLRNVALRMHLTFGSDFSIYIDSHLNEGTLITLTFPYSI